jgi:prepilin-type processing-associated H-X9-DG protein
VTLPVGGQEKFFDVPASYHNGACGFSFADGHSEIKKWLDGRTTPGVKYSGLNKISVPGSVDVQWLAERTPHN